MVLPGGERWADRPVADYRGGPSACADSERLPTDALERLSPGGSSDEAVQTLSGYVALGQLRIAREILEAARRRYPSDSRFDVLGGVIAYREGDLRQAETALSGVLARDPGNALARLDLAMTLAEEGPPPKAVARVHGLGREARNTPLGHRARIRLGHLQR